jgi:hypothetical protein
MDAGYWMLDTGYWMLDTCSALREGLGLKVEQALAYLLVHRSGWYHRGNE